MPFKPTMPAAAAVLMAFTGVASAQVPQTQNPAAGFAGTWELAVDNRSEACRLMLSPERSDKGDYFLGMPAACRHAMPGLAKIGRWGLPDATHLTLDEPSGAPVLILAAAGAAFTVTDGGRAYILRRIGPAPASADIAPLDGPTAAIVPIARQRMSTAPAPEAAPTTRDTAADLAGRYAVMREKHDTGCMLTLDDKTRGKVGGDRAQLAPGCRDQGIVIFDPVGWRLVKGTLVLTARAGHSTKLDKVDDGKWAKDAKDGGKPLGLKKL